MKTDLSEQQIAGWHTASLESLCTMITSGGTPKRLTPGYYTTAVGLPWVRTQELQDRVLHETAEHITELALNESSAKRLPKGTLLMAMYAAPTAGRMAILGREMACNQAACAFVFDSSRADTRYMFYQLLHARPDLHRLANGAAQQNLSARVLKELEVVVPPLAEQRRIAGVLGALDDLIEVNRGLIHGIMELAKAAFARAVLSDSTQARIGDIASVSSGKFLKKASRGVGEIPVIGSNGQISSTDTALEVEPVVVVGRVGACGQVALTKGPAWISDNALIVKPNFGLEPAVMYWLMKSLDFAPLIQGTTQPMIRGSDVKEQVVLVPNDLRVQAEISTLVEIQESLGEEVQQLEKTRDELLPLLMSGRIRVGEDVPA